MIRRDNKAAKRKRQYRARASKRWKVSAARIRAHYPATLNGALSAHSRIIAKSYHKMAEEWSKMTCYPGDASEPTQDNASNGASAGATR